MITVIDYGDENAKEVAKALSEITSDVVVSGSEIDIYRSDKVVFTGCGKASDAMRKIHLLNLFSVLRIIQKPMLGIGLGMQMMCNYSTEGNISCLGLITGTAIEFNSQLPASCNKGMHRIDVIKKSFLLDGISKNDKFYFDHSYYLPQNDFSTSVCKNNLIFTASVEKDNAYGVQFHPEKSGDAGLKILKNFVELDPVSLS